jgi:23S rRNA pseudouridine2605 synthase
MSQERLQRVIARAGIASRRAAEQLIASGRVRVNGALIKTLGTKVSASDKVEVDGRRIVAEAATYLVLNKPRGVVSTVRDPEGRTTVRDLLGDVTERIFPVGRLDYHTSGVLLLTNDGEFCDALLHPKGGAHKAYVVKVAGEMGEGDRAKWASGVPIESGTTAPAEVRILRHERGKTWLEVTLAEGKNQQIRRMGEATGFPVMRLSRTSFAGITSDGLKPGAYRSLTTDELQALRERFGVPRRLPRPRMAQLEDLGKGDRLRALQPNRHKVEPAHGQKTSGHRVRSDARPRSEADSAISGARQEHRRHRSGLTPRAAASRRRTGG